MISCGDDLMWYASLVVGLTRFASQMVCTGIDSVERPRIEEGACRRAYAKAKATYQAQLASVAAASVR